MNFDQSTIIEMLDISHHQGFPPKNKIFDFHKAKAYGFKGIVCRASHGIYNDNAFIYNWVSCRNVLPSASYHYYENQFHPREQAKKYWSKLEYDPRGMMFLDLEDRNAGRYYHWDYWYQFLEELKRLSGMKSDSIGIYGGHYYLRESFMRVPIATVSERLYFKQYKYWYPWYFEDSEGNPTPFDPNYKILPYTFPYDDDDLLAVQTGTPVIGSIAGSSGSLELDYNRVNGWKAYEKIFKVNHIDIQQLQISIRRIDHG